MYKRKTHVVALRLFDRNVRLWRVPFNADGIPPTAEQIMEHVARAVKRSARKHDRFHAGKPCCSCEHLWALGNSRFECMAGTGFDKLRSFPFRRTLCEAWEPRHAIGLAADPVQIDEMMNHWNTVLADALGVPRELLTGRADDESKVRNNAIRDGGPGVLVGEGQAAKP